MANSIPYINPIRFRRTDVNINYSSVLPYQDKMALQTEYQRGIYPVNYYPDFVKGKTIYIEVYGDLVSISGTAKARLQKIDGAGANMTWVDITPAGWVGDTINLLYAIVSDEGFYRIEVRFNAGYEAHSDVFNVKTWADTKDLIKINYYDDQNRYGGYFFDSSGTQKWNPVAYYTGMLKPSSPEDEQTFYTNDDGDKTLLQSSPTRSATLTITDVSDNYIDIIKQQSICSHFYVNDIRYTVGDFSISEESKSDVVDITMKLSQKDNEYFSLID